MCLKKVQSLSSRPKEAAPLAKKVYKYLSIDHEQEAEDNQQQFSIGFTVEKDWVESSKIKKKDIELRRYVDGSWESLDTHFLYEKYKELHYLSLTPGFSYFAITVKQGANPDYAFNPEAQTFSQPYTIKGTVSLPRSKPGSKKQAPSGVQVKITNLNSSESVIAVTGIGKKTGAFLTTIAGKQGDHVRIESGTSSSVLILKSRQVIQADLELSGLPGIGAGMAGITGNAIFTSFNGQGMEVNIAVMVMIVLLTGIFIRMGLQKQQ